MKLIMLIIGITIAVFLTIFIVGLPNQNNNCQSDGKSFQVSGIVSDVTFLGDCNLIDFEDGSFLYLHGSPNEKYDLYEIDNLLAAGVNYTFIYHHECVMSDGNEIWYHEGNVIDKIFVN